MVWKGSHLSEGNVFDLESHMLPYIVLNVSATCRQDPAKYVALLLITCRHWVLVKLYRNCKGIANRGASANATHRHVRKRILNLPSNASRYYCNALVTFYSSSLAPEETGLPSYIKELLAGITPPKGVDATRLSITAHNWRKYDIGPALRHKMRSWWKFSKDLQ